MVRELVQSRPQHLTHVMAGLDAVTKENFEKHRILRDTFQIIGKLKECFKLLTVSCVELGRGSETLSGHENVILIKILRTYCCTLRHTMEQKDV